MNEPKRPYEVDAAFGRELRELLNRHSVENASDTPDFVLAAYLLGCLEAFECAMHLRDTWNELGKGSSTTEPGACGDPECHVLHADPANPIHPPFYVDSREAP